ncbi:MAG TPA: rhodanese-like domain-containing protein [Kofleriaceae bacterium]|nr:rhodanese-like domain-containing protein [Kofleriaceae bacterium]
MDDIPALTVADVAARLGQPDFFVFDNNGQGRWRRSHVPGAKNLNAYSFGADALPADKASTLVFYCSGPG